MADVSIQPGDPLPKAGGTRSRKGRTLNSTALATLSRMLVERGLTDEQIDIGLDYVVDNAAATLREGFILALSRTLYSDAQLAEGKRFTIAEEA